MNRHHNWEYTSHSIYLLSMNLLCETELPTSDKVMQLSAYVHLCLFVCVCVCSLKREWVRDAIMAGCVQKELATILSMFGRELFNWAGFFRKNFSPIIAVFGVASSLSSGITNLHSIASLRFSQSRRAINDPSPCNILFFLFLSSLRAPNLSLFLSNVDTWWVSACRVVA